MARLEPSERSKLPDRAFAYIDSRGRRRLPIHDASHVRNALARFGRVNFESDAARDRARKRLLNAAKKFKIVPVGFIAGQLEMERALPPLDAGPAVLPSGFVTMLMTDVEARADEFFAVFESPRAALDSAIEMQRVLPQRTWPGDADVRVRIGIHSGYPTSTASNYVGLDVNTTSRVCALGHGGQIVVSANTREAVKASGPEGVGFKSLGAHHLRGVGAPISLYQVMSDGLRSRFPPLRRS